MSSCRYLPDGALYFSPYAHHSLKSEVLEVQDPRIADFETMRPAPSLEEQIFTEQVAKKDMDLPEFERFLRSPQETRHLPGAEPLKAKDVLMFI